MNAPPPFQKVGQSKLPMSSIILHLIQLLKCWFPDFFWVVQISNLSNLRSQIWDLKGTMFVHQLDLYYSHKIRNCADRKLLFKAFNPRNPGFRVISIEWVGEEIWKDLRFAKRFEIWPQNCPRFEIWTTKTNLAFDPHTNKVSTISWDDFRAQFL